MPSATSSVDFGGGSAVRDGAGGRIETYREGTAPKKGAVDRCQIVLSDLAFRHTERFFHQVELGRVFRWQNARR